MCCHARSCALSAGDIFSGANVTLYFLAAIIILTVSLPRCLAFVPFMGTFHFCRRVFFLATLGSFAGALSLIRVSIRCAYIGLSFVDRRYSFSQTVSIASFLFFKSSSSI